MCIIICTYECKYKLVKCHCTQYQRALLTFPIFSFANITKINQYEYSKPNNTCYIAEHRLRIEWFIIKDFLRAITFSSHPISKVCVCVSVHAVVCVCVRAIKLPFKLLIKKQKQFESPKQMAVYNSVRDTVPRTGWSTHLLVWSSRTYNFTMLRISPFLEFSVLQ